MSSATVEVTVYMQNFQTNEIVQRETPKHFLILNQILQAIVMQWAVAEQSMLSVILMHRATHFYYIHIWIKKKKLWAVNDWSVV